MDRDALQAAVDALDAAVPREGARVWLEQYGGDPDECQMLANEAGYLRFGIELLQAGLAPIDARHGLQVDLDYLIAPDSPIQFDVFERREFDPAAPAPEVHGRFIPLLLGGMLIAVLALALIGLATVIGWAVR